MLYVRLAFNSAMHHAVFRALWSGVELIELNMVELNISVTMRTRKIRVATCFFLRRALHWRGQHESTEALLDSVFSRPRRTGRGNRNAHG